MLSTTECYELLDLSSGATLEEIKTAYRKAARRVHPDVNSDPDAGEKFRAINLAYEKLSRGSGEDTTTRDYEPPQGDFFRDFFYTDFPWNYGRWHTKTEYEPITIPDPTTVIIHGAAIHIRYSASDPSRQLFAAPRLIADVYVELSDAHKLASNLDLAFGLSLDLGRASVNEWHITRDGKPYFTLHDFHPSYFKYEVKKHEKKARIRQLVSDVSGERYALAVSSEELEQDGFFTGGLEKLLSELEQSIIRIDRGYIMNEASSVANLHQQIGTIRGEISRLRSTHNRSELFVDDLIEGKIAHPAVAANHQLIDQLAVLSIRSGGFIEAFTPDSLRAFYLEKVNRQVSDPEAIRYDEFQLLDLSIEIDDFAPADLVADPELQLAPSSIDILARKGLISYAVEYDTLVIKGHDVNVGIIKLPLSVYKRNAAEYGKQSALPVLPHGIRLFIDLMNGSQPISVRGFDDRHLAAKIKKYEGGKRRSKIVDSLDDFGFRRRSVITGTEVPPWYAGQKPRWR